jgi:hypothetical protein
VESLVADGLAWLFGDLVLVGWVRVRVPLGVGDGTFKTSGSSSGPILCCFWIMFSIGDL